uniref:Uncharacterized protein n=1 Tax=Zea mays TaxID=4577 RepID=A0A804R8P0_MAIZE
MLVPPVGSVPALDFGRRSAEPAAAGQVNQGFRLLLLVVCGRAAGPSKRHAAHVKFHTPAQQNISWERRPDPPLVYASPLRATARARRPLSLFESWKGATASARHVRGPAAPVHYHTNRHRGDLHFWEKLGGFVLLPAAGRPAGGKLDR